uniref:RNA-dependent RNA polymerase n=1 Tax=Hubei blood fluke virus 1 TaxID=1922839 RepID=A0A1L3KPE6_9VIRU|nr:RNA-dependent RNA polymerase [Hubei blood fluke virus 1]APG79259.1 RNA-dependent RNA polymerase [Hubei blood fluke virus 1]APG79281.1 RNA-dependent RNA polymerase [Hubei blood fluke virus 1]
MNSRIQFKNILLLSRDSPLPNVENIYLRDLDSVRKCKEELEFKYENDVMQIFEYNHMGKSFSNHVHNFCNTGIKKIPHDFTFFWLTRHKEKRMYNYVPDLPPDLGTLTPDFVFEEDGKLYITEFSTRKLSHTATLFEAVKIKIKKYEALVTWLCKHDYKPILNVVVVSRCAVASTIAMPDSLLNDLCIRYMASLSLIEFARYEHPEINPFLLDVQELFHIEADVTPVMETLRDIEGELLSKYEKTVEIPKAIDFNKHVLYNMSLQMQKTLNDKVSMPNITINNLVAEGGRVDHLDSISRLPMIIMSKGDFDLNDLVSQDLSSLPYHLHEVWRQCIAEYCAKPYDFASFKPNPNESLEVQIRTLQGVTIEYKKKRNRLILYLDATTTESLSLLGIGGKKHKHQQYMKTHRKESQKHIDPTTYTDDIQEFIDGFEDQLTESCDDTQLAAHELLQYATPNSRWPPHVTYESLADNAYDSLLHLAIIAREVACSAAQSCRDKMFILKKIEGFQCLLLIKPTTSNQHIFFSILCNVEYDFSVGSVFPKAHKVGNYNVYDFKSLQFPMIETLLALPEMYLSVKYLAKGSKALMRNLAAGLLVALDNKADAEEVYTKTRYIYMKAVQMPKHARRPWDVLRGMPSRPRSRLTLFLLKRAITLCKSVLEMKDWGIEMGKELWSGIPAFASDDMLQNWEEVLMVIYTGYFRNKNSFMTKNQLMAMLEKIVEPELEYHKDNDYKQHVLKGNSTVPTKMEWNSGFMRFCIEQWKDKCKEQGITNPEDHVTKEFIKQLNRVRVEDLATLKASNVDTIERDYDPCYKTTPRKKLLLVLKDSIKDFGPTLETALPHALKLVSERGGTMMISLFKKPQHGGLREIYVMDVASRIIQYSMELLARVICGTLKNEAMSHVEVKTNYRQEHSLKISKEMEILKKRRIDFQAFTAFDNDDAEKWNQYQSMNKFAFMLTNMTDELIHPFIRIALSQWLNKRIRMEDSMLHSMALGTYNPSSEIAKHIVDGFRGVIDSPIALKGKCDLHIETGMMQGLLHFTSSVLHALSMLGYEALLPEFIKSQVKAINYREKTKYFAKVVTTHAVTSDDSICANTVLTNIPGSQVISCCLTGCSALKICCASMMGIISSKKKASYTTAPISEFNSQWMDRSEVIRPKIRHILACFTYASMGNFMEQMDNMCSLRQQALESGVSIHHISFINYLQGLYFYRLLGSSSGDVFGKLSEYYKKLPDPNAGFFLIDPPVASGIVSTDYNAYMLACKNPFLGAKYNMAFDESDMMIGSSGSLRSATCLSIEFSNMRKYMSLVRDLDRDTVTEYLKDHPDLLYRKARTPEESSLQIAIKLMQPNVLKSLSKDFSVMARELSASVYILWAPIVRPNKAILNSILGIESPCEKKSIAELMVEQVPIMRNQVAKGLSMMTEAIRRWFFPQYKQFDKMNLMIQEIETRLEQHQTSEPKSATSVEVFEHKMDEISLIKLCSFKWFGFRDAWTSPALYDILWEEATQIYPFLYETHDSTMEMNQIDQAQKLKIILDRTQKKGKVIRPTSRGGRAVRSSGLISFISYNFKEGVVLKPRDFVEKDDTILKHLRRITMCLQLPIENWRKENLIMKEINEVGYDVWKSSLRFSPLCLVHKDNPAILSVGKVLDICKGTNSIVGAWVVRQKRSYVGKRAVWTGRGIWTGYFCSSSKMCRVVLTIHDSELTKIQTDNLECLSEQRSKLLKLLERWQIRPVTVKHTRAVTHFNVHFDHAVGTPVFVDRCLLVTDDNYDKTWEICVIDKAMHVLYDGTPIYEFVSRADLVQFGTSERPRDVFDCILNNSPIEYDYMANFLVTEYNDTRSEIQNWIKDLIKKKSPYYDEDNLIDMEPPISIFDFQQDSETIFSTMTGEFFTAIGTDDSIEAHCLDTEECIQPRVFEAEVNHQNIVSSVHYGFLRKFINEALIVSMKIERQGHPSTKIEQMVMEVFMGKKLPIRSIEISEDLWEGTSNA